MKPKIPIVDENDNVIGYKNREEILPTDIYRVTALWVTNDKGEVLITQRSFNKSHDPGKWHMAVAGTVEGKETYEENIIKEAREELGIEGIKFNLGTKTFRRGKHLHFTQWFTLIINQPESFFKIQPSEVVAIKWMPLKQLIPDITNHPEKYVASAPKWIKQFTT